MGSSSRSGEGVQAVFEQAGVNDIIASKCFMLLEYTQKIEIRTGSVREKARTRGPVKSRCISPSPEEATPLGETSCCGKLLKLDSTTPFSKESGGTRVMTGSNGNNLSRYMGNPQGYCLIDFWKMLVLCKIVYGFRLVLF